jgi:ATP-dependent DNA ligase
VAPPGSSVVKLLAMKQPKLNGIRCVTYTDLRHQSRLGKFWSSLSHIDEDCKKLIDILKCPLDGEIFIPGLCLQDIGALVKKERIDEDVEGYKSEDLEYWIFDYVSTEPFSERYFKLIEAFNKCKAVRDKTGKKYTLGKCVLVPTYQIISSDAVQEYHTRFISEEFEGTIIRNDVPYVLCPGGKHCHDLQKKKDCMDQEFKIIGGKEGVGREKGCVTFRCITKDGNEFDVRPRGTLLQRKEWFKNLGSFVGKDLTCIFQEWTKSPAVPFHARGVVVRDYE